MNFYSISYNRSALLSLRLGYYPNLKSYVGATFYWNMDTLDTAGLHILTYGVNNIKLVVI